MADELERVMLEAEQLLIMYEIEEEEARLKRMLDRILGAAHRRTATSPRVPWIDFEEFFHAQHLPPGVLVRRV